MADHHFPDTILEEALKIGMDAGQAVARFEAGRQALAMMEHPHIATVFDGGATENGRPDFVMELVRVVPITTYCDANKLTPRARIDLIPFQGKPRMCWMDRGQVSRSAACFGSLIERRLSSSNRKDALP